MTPLGARLKAALDGIWNAGRTPYVQVDLPVPGLPEHIGKAAEARGMVGFDLRAIYPLNLVYTDDGFQVDLAFAGTVSRCTVYWAAVSEVAEISDDGGTLVYSRLSEQYRPGYLADRPTPTAPPPPKLTVIVPRGSPKLTLIRGGKA